MKAVAVCRLLVRVEARGHRVAELVRRRPVLVDVRPACCVAVVLAQDAVEVGGYVCERGVLRDLPAAGDADDLGQVGVGVVVVEAVVTTRERIHELAWPQQQPAIGRGESRGRRLKDSPL